MTAERGSHAVSEDRKPGLPPKNWPRVNVRNWAKGGGTDGKAKAYAGAGDQESAGGRGYAVPIWLAGHCTHAL